MEYLDGGFFYAKHGKNNCFYVYSAVEAKTSSERDNPVAVSLASVMTAHNPNLQFKFGIIKKCYLF